VAEHDAELSPHDAVAVQASLGRALHYAGDTGAAHALVEGALAAARGLGHPELLTHALAASVQIRVPMHAYDFDVIVARAGEVWDLREQVEDRMPAASMMEYATVASLARGARAEAMDWLKRLEFLTEVTGSRFERYVLMCQRQATSFLDGDLDLAEQRAGQNLEFAEELGEDVSGVHGVQMFLIRREQDRLGELVPVVRMLLRANPAAAMWRPGLVLLLSSVELRDDAETLLHELVTTGFAGLPRDSLFPAAVAFLAESAWLLRAAEARGQLEQSLLPWAGTGISVGHFVGHLGAADRYLGLLAELAGRLDDAARRLSDALDFNRGLGAVIWEAHTLADLAGVERARGALDRARLHVAEARVLAERHGFAAVHRRLDALAF
jgi:hypothetical protein